MKSENKPNILQEHLKLKTYQMLILKNVIPKDKYLVLGDNREVSKDSRSFGLIDKDQIVGKVSFRFWPFNEFKSNFSGKYQKLKVYKMILIMGMSIIKNYRRLH